MVFLVSYLKHLVSPVLPVIHGCFLACLSASSVQSLGAAQSTGNFRSQLGGFLEICERLIPNFSVNRDLLISFMLSLISECRGPACIVLTQWNFLCGETYVADSLHQLKTDLCLQKKTLFFLPTPPSNIEFDIPTEYLLSAATGCSPQTTQELALNWVVQIQLST